MLKTLFLFLAVACRFLHPPNTEDAKKFVFSVEGKDGEYYAKITVKYTNHKDWTWDIPQKFETSKEAVEFFEKWKIHVLNVVHYGGEK
jgi:hypothetical protein